MKKLILIILTVTLLASCERGFENQNKLTESSNVSIASIDSSRYKPAKVLILDNTTMYVKVNGSSYRMYSDAPVGFYVGLFLCILCIGVLIGMKIAE